jgi:hypothetical protein
LEDHPLQSNISIYPEFVAYTYNLYGFSRKLLMYIIFYELNKESCRFLLDGEMMKRFHNFCFLFGEEAEAEKNILQATGTLKRKNIIISTSGEEYMLNPLIAGGSNRFKRKKLIDHYTQLLVQKGLDASVDFYPRYQ